MIAELAMSFCIDAIPAELRDLNQWVVWKAPVKLLCDPKSGQPADSTDPETWASFTVALECWRNHPDVFAGIGFVFTESDPYCGVDLDKCVDEDGELYHRAAKAIQRFSSYTEFSPSGKGVHIIVRAKKPGDRCKKSGFEWAKDAVGAVELYDRDRYFTITGNVVPDTTYTVEARQDQVSHLYAYLFPVAKSTTVAGAVDAAARCRAYLEKCPDSISGQGGHDKALRAACECMRFGLSDAQSLETMRWWSASKSGSEPWNEREIAHKIVSARAKVQAEGGIGIRLRAENHPPARRLVHAKPAPSSLRDRLERIIDGSWAAVDLPWPTLASATQALIPGTVTLVCGDPGAGKSFFMLQCVYHWLFAGVPFKIFELEEDSTYHLHRVLAMLDGNSNMTNLAWIKSNPDEARRAEEQHRDTIGRLREHIWDAPESRVHLKDLAEWYESVAKDNRVVVIDPVTAANAGDKRWIADGEFIERCKTIANKTEGSLVLVTHPKPGRKNRITLEDLAGGADYPRFSQCVLVVAHQDPAEELLCRTHYGRAPYQANRKVQIIKARNGRANGSEIAFDFNPRELRFNELGLVIDE